MYLQKNSNCYNSNSFGIIHNGTDYIMVTDIINGKTSIESFKEGEILEEVELPKVEEKENASTEIIEKTLQTTEIIQLAGSIEATDNNIDSSFIDTTIMTMDKDTSSIEKNELKTVTSLIKTSEITTYIIG